MKLPAAGEWTYISPVLSYEEIEGVLGRRFDADVDQVLATNTDWRSAQVLAVPFVQTVSPENGGSIGVAVTVPTGQAGAGTTRSVTVSFTVIKGR